MDSNRKVETYRNSVPCTLEDKTMEVTTPTRASGIEAFIASEGTPDHLSEEKRTRNTEMRKFANDFKQRRQTVKASQVVPSSTKSDRPLYQQLSSKKFSTYEVYKPNDTFDPRVNAYLRKLFAQKPKDQRAKPTSSCELISYSDCNPAREMP